MATTATTAPATRNAAATRYPWWIAAVKASAAACCSCGGSFRRPTLPEGPPAPCAVDAISLKTIEPISAMPKTPPIWRAVLAVAEATPACSRGIPATAPFVIGGFTRPIPTLSTR
jgi:hypothetical protein